MLEAMFGAAAIQHAPSGSYPRHLQRAFEQGLAADGARSNRFLHRRNLCQPDAECHERIRSSFANRDGHFLQFSHTMEADHLQRLANQKEPIAAPSYIANHSANSVGIDLRLGALAVPAPINKTGWWKDGAAPGDKSGTVLIAGHVDSSRGGPGAFFRLRNAARNQVIEVKTATGATKRYRVRSSRTYIKEQLPPGLFTNRGRPRLVVVTCGGPFIQSEGFYRDNVVVVATPV